MKRMFQIMFICFTVSIFSCSSDDDVAVVANTFQGEWSGTFSGDSDGLWTATVSSNGTVTGFADGLELSGTVTNSGTFNATVGDVQGGATFVGQFSGSNGTGTWENVSLNESGTWVGTKQ